MTQGTPGNSTPVRLLAIICKETSTIQDWLCELCGPNANINIGKSPLATICRYFL
ncbi:MAG: hypothetical protein IKR25_03255 [Muribaculaceae bacterium]|nr:hypothetical protein [Muribaculaceae bacterium]